MKIEDIICANFNVFFIGCFEPALVQFHFLISSARFFQGSVSLLRHVTKTTMALQKMYVVFQDSTGGFSCYSHFLLPPLYHGI